MANEPKYFQLYTKVFVSKDNNYRNNTRLLTSIQQESSINTFVTVGETNKVSFYNYDRDDEYLYWMLSGNPSDTVLSFNFYRTSENEIISKHLWYTYNMGVEPIYEDKLRVRLKDENGEETGCIEFGSTVNSGSIYDVNKTPFHIKADSLAETFYLSFNSEDISEHPASRKTNGKDWDCSLYIIDPNNPAFNDDITIKTLELPSVYKPFYMRGLLRVENSKNGSLNHKVFMTMNIYNGIGYFTRNILQEKVYKVCDLSLNLNGEVYSSDINRTKPTLINSYSDSISEISKTDFRSVKSLTDINLTCSAKEQGPTGNESYGIFSTNIIYEKRTVSFYKINYTGITGNDSYTITMDENSFVGDSSDSVEYFLVSSGFTQLFININPTCNTQQRYEVQAEKAKGEYNTGYIGYKQFLSLYGTVYHSKYSTRNYVNPTAIAHVIRINTEEIINNSDPTVFTFSGTSQWNVIGITDPLVDLLSESEELFLKEYQFGTVLPPHKNFLTIMTYK